MNLYPDSNAHVLYPDPDVSKWQGDPDVSITGSGFAVPRGIEAILSYNGIVMNDLSVYDKYRVMSIDGLADADVRDNREEKPSDDGEDAYTNLYGGRTISIKVRVEAYQLDKLRDMEEALRSAFVNMEEKPLYFLTGDPEKDHYVMCKKSAALTKEEDVSNLNYRHFREWQITLRASDPRFYRAKKKYLATLINIENPELNAASGFESASSTAGYTFGRGSLNQSFYASSISTDWSAGGTKSMKLVRDTDGMNTPDTVKIWREVSPSTVIGNSSYTISGNIRTEADDVLLIDYARVTPYLFFLDANGNILNFKQGQTNGSNWFYNDVEWAYTVTGVSPPATKRLLLELRVEARVDFTAYFDNLSMRFTYPYGSVGSSKITNVGNYNSEPVIRLFGGMTNITLYNDNAPAPFNNIKFKPSVSIPDGQFYIIDIKNRTIKNQDGVNKLSDLDKTSGWIKLYPGSNTIYLDEDTTFGGSVNSQFTFEWNDAWV